MTAIDLDGLADMLRATAAAEIMPRFRRLGAGDVRAKTAPTDLVTAADLAAERAITDVLARRHPDAAILGEEAVADDPGLLDTWPGDGLAFALDPVDGTFNFAAGVAAFGTMLAVVRGGETVAGLVLDPVSGDLMIAERGGGAWLRRAGGGDERLCVAAAVPVDSMLGVVAWQHAGEPERSLLARNHAGVLGSANYRCAAQEYRLLATGFLHFAFYRKLMPWDHLAGALIVAEAGGHVRLIDGRSYRPADRGPGLLAAPDADSWVALRDLLTRP